MSAGTNSARPSPPTPPPSRTHWSAYEAVLFERAASTAVEAQGDVELIVGAGAPHQLAALVTSDAPTQDPGPRTQQPSRYRQPVKRVTPADDIRSIELSRLAAIVTAESDALEALHAPDFLLCTPSGTVWSKRHYVDGLVDGTIRYTRFEPVTPLEVIVDSLLAVIRYRSVIEIGVDHAPPASLECWHLDVYERGDRGRWRCRWSQATDTILD